MPVMDVVTQYLLGVPTDELVDWDDPLAILIAREESQPED